MAGYRPEYTLDEEKTILRYIIVKKDFRRLKGDYMWKLMADSGEVNRTWQSLKQHFRKKLVNKLNHPYFELTAEERKMILDGFNGLLDSVVKRTDNRSEKTEPVVADQRECPSLWDLTSSSSSDSE